MRRLSKSRLFKAWAVCAALVGQAVSAQNFELNASPFMPSVQARHALAILADEADLPLLVTHWPQPANAVHEALDKLKGLRNRPLTELQKSFRDLVRAELVSAQRGVIQTTLRNRAEGFVGFGEDYTPGSSLRIQSPVWLAGSDDGWRVSGRLAVRAEDDANAMGSAPGAWTGHAGSQVRLTDSSLVASLDAVNVQAFSHNTWWSPGWQSSLLASNNVPAWNAIGVQRATNAPSPSPWLNWLGPWSYEWFVAQAQDPQVLANQHTGYLYSGMRITAKPAPWIEIAASQMLQSSGKGHYQGLKAYLNGLIGKGSNADTAAQAQVDPGNSLAGFDLRMSCAHWGLRCAVYGQAMGEDAVSAGSGIPFPYRFLTLGGLETWSADGRHRWFVEYADTHCQTGPGSGNGNYGNSRTGCAYINSQYLQGETNGTRWQGSSFGPDSAMTTVGWYDAENMRLIKVMRGDIGKSVGGYNPSISNVPWGNAWGFNAKQTLDWSGVRWTPEVSYMHLGSGQNTGQYKTSDWRIGMTATMALFEPVRTAPSGFLGVSERDYKLWPDLMDSAQLTAKRLTSPEVTPGWAWAVGGILAARLLDRRMNNWAVEHQSGSYKTLGKVGSDLPIAMAAGVGLMGLGLTDDNNARLAGIAATSAALALAGNTALKFVVGRQRPELNQGDASFSNFNTKAMNSSFASTHTAVAFALITPYAQSHDMPWLYGLGALTALGRVQQRQHWLSDTVAGGAMGYAISSAMMGAKKNARYGAAPLDESQVVIAPTAGGLAMAWRQAW